MRLAPYSKWRSARVDAADDDPLRIEQVDQERQAQPELFGAQPEHIEHRPVAAVGELDDLARAPPARELLDAAAGAEPLERPRLSVADRPVRFTAHVPDLARHVVRARIQLPVEYQPRAEPRPERQKHHIPRASARAEPPLRQRARVRVVLQKRRHAETAGNGADDRHLVPAGQIRRRQDQAARRVERSAAADSDRLRALFGERLKQRAEHLSPAGALPRAYLAPEQHVSRIVPRNQRALRAADVDSPDISPHEIPPPSPARFHYKSPHPRSQQW